MKLRLIAVLFCLLPVCSFAQPVRVAVSANAQFVAAKLKEVFTRETGIEVALTVGSSGKLTAQIEQGAPFDVFLSADMKYPQELYTKGFTTAKPKVYAYGALVMWSGQRRDLSKGLSVVDRKDVVHIAVANPKLAPYGEAALQALTASGLVKTATPKLVYGESISQVNQYLISGAADLAFTAKSVVLDTAWRNKGSWVEVSQKLYQPIAQGVVLIRSQQPESLAAAEKFYKFLFGKQAKAIFVQYGYR